MKSCSVFLGGLFGCLAVGAGAFGEHMFGSIHNIKLFHDYMVAVNYQLWHSIVLVALGLFFIASDSQPKLCTLASSCFILGILLFSGAIYMHTVFGLTQFILGVPIGGFLFILGWFLLMLYGLCHCKQRCN